MKTCEELSGRLKEICTGEAELPLYKINAYRQMWELPPLLEEDIDFQVIRREVSPPFSGNTGVPRQTFRVVGASKKEKRCSGCRGSKPPTNTELPISGPGTTLLGMFKKAGFISCPACISLANKMDTWGKSLCRDKISEIVQDILPRALEWERAKVGWWSILMPVKVTQGGLFILVSTAIEASEE